MFTLDSILKYLPFTASWNGRKRNQKYVSYALQDMENERAGLHHYCKHRLPHTHKIRIPTKGSYSSADSDE